MSTSYEARRLENIQRNQALVADLGLQNGLDLKQEQAEVDSKAAIQKGYTAAKRRKVQTSQPTRTSARIANAVSKPTYAEPDEKSGGAPTHSSERKSRGAKTPQNATQDADADARTPKPDVEVLIAGWTSWKPVAGPPTRDEGGDYHFESHPTFTPNKSPEEIMREGCFGGSYWRPLYSRRLGVTVADDWRELPASWVAGLAADRYLASPAYDAAVNKFGVACGQSIEEWEAAGWIAHEHDVRGWFQWYCRFWMGRRCADDERQIGRWRKCVGETGRWRRALLKKYVQMGIRSVADEGDDDEGERGDVSPVVHQTCHHWAWEVRQEALDRFWAEGI
ncbi:hypothetical protein F4778DRAFT_792397 [Xylariomycetidae sp. FL2044]|nr:hypothetical protein F4778DRAFT_792397 [Xylariomycetidae sp. FL2044]